MPFTEPFGANLSKPVPRSSLPRPQAIGRSGSSASSKSGATLNRTKSPASQASTSEADKPEPKTSGKQKTGVSDSDSNDEDDERFDNLLATCFTSGMAIPKSRSEPVDLKSKSLSKLRRDKSTSNGAEKVRARSKSKSPRNSRFIPGVRITELKLVSRHSDQQKSETSTPTKVEPLAVKENETKEEINLIKTEPDLQVDPVESCKPVEDETTLMETLTESRVLELEANRVVETVVEHQRLEQQNHYRLNMAKRTLMGSIDDSMTR